MSVYLVGAGPGDPELLTLKGRDLLNRADVVIYDDLAWPGLLALCKPGAKLISAGKRGGAHSMSQAEINRILIEEGRAAATGESGKTVVRLKGGDPFLFGRGGEEMQALQAAELACEVVPGVSSAIAAPAYAGIPVTHRECASSLAIVSGHAAPGNHSPDWQALAKGADTLVVLMGMSRLFDICAEIEAAGLAPTTPAAVVEWGSLGRQRKVVGELAHIATEAQAAGLGAPAVLVLGRVAAFGEGVSWFEQKPLFGRRVVVTRAAGQAAELAGLLRGLGAEVIELPLIEIRPLADNRALARVLGRLVDYSWLVFTSGNGVRIFFNALHEGGQDARALGGVKIAAIGPGTAAALGAYRLNPDFVPETYIAESLAEGLAARLKPGDKPVLIVRGRLARVALENRLAAGGIAFETIPIYDTALPDGAASAPGLQALADALAADNLSAITFCSSSAVDNFFRLVQPVHIAAKQPCIACIGPITAESLKKYGLSCTVQPDTHSLPALVAALGRHFNKA